MKNGIQNIIWLYFNYLLANLEPLDFIVSLPFTQMTKLRSALLKGWEWSKEHVGLYTP